MAPRRTCPFIAQASIMPFSRCRAHRRSWLVPYLPLGRSSAPSKMTWTARRKSSSPKLPAFVGRTLSRTSAR